MTISITIPENSKCLGVPGDKLTLNKILFEANVSNTVEVMIAEELDVPPQKIFRYLKKFLGESVQKGDVIALKKNLLSTSRVYSETAGTVREIDHKSGKLFIEVTLAKTNQISSPLIGVIKSIGEKTLDVTVGKVEEFGAKNISANQDFGGETVYSGPQETNITLDVENKILVSQNFSSLAVTKAEALGAAGFVSVHPLEDKTTVPHLSLLKTEDFERIGKSNLPYCFIDVKKSKIYFYSTE